MVTAGAPAVSVVPAITTGGAAVDGGDRVDVKPSITRAVEPGARL